MNRSTFVLAPLGAVSALVFLAASPSADLTRADLRPAAASAPQDPAGFRQESTWNFAFVDVQTTAGEGRRLMANQMAKMWITVYDEGAIRMEILHSNKDYECLSVRDFAVIRSAAGTPSRDVDVVRDGKAGFAFPTMR